MLRSRKVWTALIGAVGTLAMHYAGIPPEVWIPIDALLLALIGSIALEDAAEKRAGAEPRSRTGAR